MSEYCPRFSIVSRRRAAAAAGARRVVVRLSLSLSLSLGLGGLSLTGLAGCGGSSDAVGKVTVYPVKGKVLLPGGQPLTSGRVVFLPLGALMIESSGPIQSDGTFSLSTAESGEGAPPGEFRVRIEPDASTSNGASAGARSARSRRLPFPAQYADEETSGLTATVKPEPNELAPFRLEKRLGARSVASVRVRD